MSVYLLQIIEKYETLIWLAMSLKIWFAISIRSSFWMSCDISLSVFFSNNWFSLITSLPHNFKSYIKFKFSSFLSLLNADLCWPKNCSVFKILIRHFVFSFMPNFVGLFDISIMLPQREIGTSKLSAARWDFNFWWTLKAVVALFQLSKATEKNAPSLFFYMVSFKAFFKKNEICNTIIYFIVIWCIVIFIVKSCSKNHWGWKNWFWFFWKINEPGEWYGFGWSTLGVCDCVGVVFSVWLVLAAE